MPVEQIMLTGDAVPGLLVNDQHRLALFDDTPVPATLMVKTGRNPPRHRKPVVAASQLMKYLKNVPVPASIDYYTKAAAALARMYKNDTWGCCVFSGKAHNLGIWSYNDPDSGGGVQCTDAEIKQQYFDYTGGGDNGAIISEVYDLMKSPGFLAGGKRYTIAGYITCDWTSKELTQACIAVFGAGSIGINLPSAWTNANIWDVTNTSIVGGHDVSQCGYGDRVLGTTADGVVISSWGRCYVITWRAWQSRKWLSECFFAVPTKLWTGDDKLAPSGATYAELLADLKLAEQGQSPPYPGTSPPPPPVPPVPPAPEKKQVAQVAPVSVPVSVSALGGLFKFSGTVSIPGQLAPVVDAAAAGPLGDHANWLEIGKLVAKLAFDAFSENWSEVPADIMAILSALHILGAAPLVVNVQAEASLQVSWFRLVMDFAALARAVYARDVAGIIAALTKIAADLGLNIG